LRQLIVNADDFGFTRDVNEGIVHACREGILTATTLMATGAAFEHAVELAADVHADDVSALLGQSDRVRAPLSPRRSGDEGDATVHSAHA